MDRVIDLQDPRMMEEYIDINVYAPSCLLYIHETGVGTAIVPNFDLIFVNGKLFVSHKKRKNVHVFHHDGGSSVGLLVATDNV